MTKLEDKHKKGARKTRLQEAILRTLMSHDKLSASAVIPEALNYLFDLDLPVYSRRNEVVQSAMHRLHRHGLIDLKDGRYSLSRTGQEKLEQWEKTNYKVRIPKKWDGKWRVVIFDIPEKKRKIRIQAKQILEQAGFKRLQDSVWVIPYECEEMVALMKTDLGIGKYLLYMIVDQIENDRHLRMDFNLL